MNRHSVLAILCAGLFSISVGCSDDETPAPTPDSGVDGAAGAAGAKSDASNDVSQPKDSSTTDVVVADTSPAVDVVDTDHAVVVPDGGPGDAAKPDATPDVAVADAPAEAADSGQADHVEAGVLQLHMCLQLDKDFGIATDAGGCANVSGGVCPDRAKAETYGWAGMIANDFLFGALQAECRTMDMFATTDPTIYVNQVLQFTEDFFGCPESQDYTPAPFGLLPVEVNPNMTPVTTADLNVLVDYYVDAIVQARTELTPPAPVLTSAQLADIRASLAQRVAATPGIRTSNKYDFDSTCPSDAGTD